MSKVCVFIQLQLVIITSAPSVRKMKRGRRLVKKASFTAVLTCERAQCGLEGRMVERMGYDRIAKMMSKLEDITMDEGCIAATWICTKSFWFLRPMDELLSFRSG